MSTAIFNLPGETQIANNGNAGQTVRTDLSTNRAVAANPVNSNFAQLFAELLGQTQTGTALESTDPVTPVIPGLPIIETWQNGQLPATNAPPIASALDVATLTTPIQVPVISDQPIIQPGPNSGIVVERGPEVSGLPFIPPKQGSVVPQLGQGPEVSGLPFIPGGKKNPIIPQIIPNISPGEKPETSVQNQNGVVEVKSATLLASQQQQGTQVGTQVNVLSAAQVLSGAALSPVKNESVGPAATRIEAKPSSLQPGSGSSNSGLSNNGTSSAPSASSSVMPVNLSTIALTNTVVPNVNVAANAGILNNTIQFTPVVTEQVANPLRGTDFASITATETAAASTEIKTTTQSSSISNSQTIAVANSPLSAKIGAETVAKFAARLASRAATGATKFEMRLDPPQLGRIEVKIEVTSDNRVQAILAAENPEVLQDMQKNADSLRRALLREGFDLGSNDLEFQLHQEGNDSAGCSKEQSESAGNEPLQQVILDAMDKTNTEIDTGYGYLLVPDQRIDITA